MDGYETAIRFDEDRRREVSLDIRINMKTNIALIGYMGTGKTAAGQILSEKSCREFIELDWFIEKQAGKSIPDIFQESGEIGFRELEIEATKQVAGKDNAVIACGGGIVLNKINIDRLRENGVIVRLTAAPEVILERVSVEKGQRPLLEVEDQLKTIKEMLEYREPYYERSADITIDTSELSIEGVADRITEELKSNEGFNL
jgi:shikimate kinase